ncbi:g1025 [Coccomyxa viridis]|uniref:G1025 protein n=1 Tax=Coccomyxa viridis TaxID=1274662 RepID=A0ABP1FK08_9CHLO
MGVKAEFGGEEVPATQKRAHIPSLRGSEGTGAEGVRAGEAAMNDETALATELVPPAQQIPANSGQVTGRRASMADKCGMIVQ